MPLDGSRLDQETRSLITARARIERNGWCQGAYRDEYGRYCLMAALGYDEEDAPLAATRKSSRYRALLRVVTAIGNADPVVWNDRRKRTKQEVLDALDRAITGESEQHWTTVEF